MEKKDKKIEHKKEDHIESKTHKSAECDCAQTECTCDDKAEQYLNLAKRIQADFENYRKRNENVYSEARESGIEFAAEKMLPVLDSLTSAKKQVENKELLNNLDVLYSQLLQAFKNLNIQKIDAVGKIFDPHFHNAILVEEKKDVEPNTVLEEFQEGFTLNNKVLRHTVVKISK